MNPQFVPAAPKSQRIHRTASQWQAYLEAYAQSGLSVTAFCHREGLSPASLHNWRRRLAQPANGAIAPDALPSPAPAFVELGSTRHALDAGLKVRLELGAGIVLELSRL